LARISRLQADIETQFSLALTVRITVRARPADDHRGAMQVRE